MATSFFKGHIKIFALTYILKIKKRGVELESPVVWVFAEVGVRFWARSQSPESHKKIMTPHA